MVRHFMYPIVADQEVITGSDSSTAKLPAADSQVLGNVRKNGYAFVTVDVSS